MIVDIIHSLNTLLKNRDFDRINTVLACANPQLLTPEKMIALARTTYAVRDNLPCWHNFVASLVPELDRRGMNAKELLIGFVDEAGSA